MKAGKASRDVKSVLELAESSEWSALDRLVTAEPERADDMDDFGMMPLHWACTDTHVPLRVVKKLVDAAPSALSHKNKGGLLPLHIAVKAATRLEVLRALVQAAPDVAACLFEETPTGETPAELAKTYQLTEDKVQYFMDMESHLRAEGRAPDRPGARFQAFLNQPGGLFQLPSHARCAVSDETASVSSFRSLPTALGHGDGSGREGRGASGGSGNGLDDDWTNSNHSSHTATAGRNALRFPDGLAGVPLPPRWRLDKRCNICQLKFSYFKTRHHCRSCGESVCSAHSNKRLPLHHLGLKAPQRVCILCFDDLRENGAPSAVVNMYGHGRHSGLPSMESKLMEQEFGPLLDYQKAPGRSPLRSINSTVSLTNTSSSSRDSAFRSPSDAEYYPRTSNSTFAMQVRTCVDDGNSSETCNTDHDPVLTTALPFEDDSSQGRIRAWTDVDSNEKYQDMQEQVRELESHVHELALTKSRIEKKLEDATRLAAAAKKERAAVEDSIADLRDNRTFDINRVSLGDDGGDDEDQDHDAENQDKCDSTCDVRRRLLIQDEKKVELIEDTAVDVAETCNYLGQVYLDRGDFTSAVAEFRKSVASNRRDVDMWINLARALHGAGKFYDAEIAVRRALVLAPKSYALVSMLGRILHSKGDHDSAVDVFRQALGLMNHEEESDDDVGSMTVGW